MSKITGFYFVLQARTDGVVVVVSGARPLPRLPLNAGAPRYACYIGQDIGKAIIRFYRVRSLDSSLTCSLLVDERARRKSGRARSRSERTGRPGGGRERPGQAVNCARESAR